MPTTGKALTPTSFVRARCTPPNHLNTPPPHPPTHTTSQVSAKTEEDDIVQGLRCGADDYVPKPFKRAELAARIRAHIRARDAFQQQQVGGWGSRAAGGDVFGQPPQV